MASWAAPALPRAARSCGGCYRTVILSAAPDDPWCYDAASPLFSLPGRG